MIYDLSFTVLSLIIANRQQFRENCNLDFQSTQTKQKKKKKEKSITFYKENFASGCSQFRITLHHQRNVY